MSQGLFDRESDGEENDDGDDEESLMLPLGGSKGRKTAKERRKANERKKEVGGVMTYILKANSSSNISMN